MPRGKASTVGRVAANSRTEDGHPLADALTKDVAADLATHAARTDNPHAVTKGQVGLGNVPNLDTTTAIAQAHTRLHALDDGADHTGVAGAVEDNVVAFDADGLPKDSGIAAAGLALQTAASDTFTTMDGKTVTVVNGVITSIV